MKVAVLAPLTWRTPPRNYGPWEQVASVLIEALVKEGIDVTLFATKKKLYSFNLHPEPFKVRKCPFIVLGKQSDSTTNRT